MVGVSSVPCQADTVGGDYCMVNSMGSAPIMNFGFKHIVIQNGTGNVTSVHIVPTEQFSHHLDSQGSCLCGPNLDYDGETGMIVSRVVHFALEKAFYQYNPEDLYRPA